MVEAGTVATQGKEIGASAGASAAAVDRRDPVSGAHGVQWRDLPPRYGPWQTVYGLFRRWQRDGTWKRILTQLQAQADADGLITWDVSVDSTVARAHQHAAGARKKGLINVAVIARPGGHQYIFRRSIADGEIAYFHCYNPREEGMSELVRVIGSRWPIEECFEAAKQEAGLDQYQFRLYHAWYPHVTLAVLALAFLAVLRRTVKKGNPFPVDNPSRL